MKSYWESYINSSQFDKDALLKGIRRERAERSLAEFIKQSWPVIEPGTKYIENWHIDLICEYLQAVKDGQMKRLVINIPPRHMKSINVTVCFPCWTWIDEPEKQFIKVSYSDALSRKHNVLSRDIILSDWYRQNWGDVVQLKDDVNRQNEFKNTHQGMMFSTSTGGSLTGMGADIIIVDDPQSPLMANSETERQGTIDFFKNTLQTRLNDPKNGAIIIVMQRLHEMDLTGYVLAEDLGYEHICLPAEAEKKTVITFPVSKKQIVREEGEILNPQRYDRESLDSLRKSMGSLQYSGQMQQRPAPADGNIFKKAWLQHYFTQAPHCNMIMQSWDLPFKASEGSAKCAGFVMGRSGANIYVFDMVNEKMNFTTNVKAIRDMTAKHPKARAKVVEDKANGPAIIDVLSKEIPGMVPYNPKGSKEERAIATTPYFEAGNIFLPDPNTASWVADLQKDLLIFPKGVYKDTVDALVQGILYLMDKPSQTGPPTDMSTTRSSYWKSGG